MALAPSSAACAIFCAWTCPSSLVGVIQTISMGMPCVDASSFAALSAPFRADRKIGLAALFAIIAIRRPGARAGAAAGAGALFCSLPHPLSQPAIIIPNSAVVSLVFISASRDLPFIRRNVFSTGQPNPRREGPAGRVLPTSPHLHELADDGRQPSASHRQSPAEASHVARSTAGHRQHLQVSSESGRSAVVTGALRCEIRMENEGFAGGADVHGDGPHGAACTHRPRRAYEASATRRYSCLRLVDHRTLECFSSSPECRSRCGHTDVMAEPSANVRSAVNFWD